MGEYDVEALSQTQISNIPKMLSLIIQRLGVALQINWIFFHTRQYPQRYFSLVKPTNQKFINTKYKLLHSRNQRKSYETNVHQAQERTSKYKLEF